MAQIPNLQSTNILGEDDQAVLRQGTIDKRIGLNLAGILSWAKRNGYNHLGGHTIGVQFPDTISFTTFQGKVYFVKDGVQLPYNSSSNDPESDSNLLRKTEDQLKKEVPLPMLAAALRREGGVWSLIDDSAHKPIGITGVTEPDEFSYRLEYETTADKVGSIVSVVDKELAPYGIHTGAQGGLSDGVFTSWAPCSLYVDGWATLSASPLWTSQIGAIDIPNSATMVLNHPPRALPVDPPVLTLVTPQAGASHNPQYQISWSANTTTITGLDNIQGLVQCDGTTASLSSTPNIGTSVELSSATIVITHDNAQGNYIPHVSSFNSPLRPEIQSVTDTTIAVQFRDSNGAVVTVPSSDMNFYFTRESLVPSAIDSACRFGVDLGLCQVKNEDLENISLNNFWILGINSL